MTEYEFDEESMPTPCKKCGRVFDLYDGVPCHKCHVIFCRDCARDTDDGYRCFKCKPRTKHERKEAGTNRHVAW